MPISPHSGRSEEYYRDGLWLYADATSYAPGDTATVFVSSPVSSVDCELVRLGGAETVVHEARGLSAKRQDIPEDADCAGCRWTDTFAVEIGADWPSGYYAVRLRAGELAAEHFLVVRAASPGREARHVLVLATNTYQAYNHWGGRNYYGDDTPFVDAADQLTNRPEPTRIVSWERPYAPLLLAPPVPTRPAAAQPREADAPPNLPEATPALIAAGGGVWDLAAGYVNKWEHRFVAWAEARGLPLDFLAQSDLDRDPDALGPYAAYVSVGHDEYWTWAERDVVEGFVEGGGNAAFFSGNTSFWQVRFEQEGRLMVGYKAAAPTRDPVLGTDRERLLTSMWSDPLIGRPENEMTGVSFARGGYARVGYAGSRSSGGYAVQRPDHWALEGTNLFYGDVFGAESTLVGYETDGCALQIDEDGRLVPTGVDGTPTDFEVVGVAPATLGEPEVVPTPGLLGRIDADFVASRLFDGDTERSLRGFATCGSFRKGQGEVFTGGTTEWAWALEDPSVGRITENVLRRFG